MFTRFPQQTISYQSQNNILQEDADGMRNNKYFYVVSQMKIITVIHSMSVWLLAQLARPLFCFQVMINNGFTPNKDDYEFCTKVDNMIIPTEGFFGISAATGGLAGTVFLFPTNRA